VTDEEPIGVGRPGAVRRLTLNNPPANALSFEAMEALQAELDAAPEDASVRVIVIAAAGKLFSAGHDLKHMTAHRRVFRKARPRLARGIEKGARSADPFNFSLRLGYASCGRIVLRRRRRIAMPMPPKPTSIIAQVAGSGTGGVVAR
jgi:hypothetical protein